MSKVVTVNEFAAKFAELNEPNQRYIIAIQQALLYSQEHENWKNRREKTKRNEML